LIRLSAIIVVGGSAQEQRTSSDATFHAAGDVVATSLAAVELLGSSPLERTICRLQSQGVESIRVVSSAGRSGSDLELGVQYEVAPDAEAAWEQAADFCRQHAERGTDVILIMRLGAYVEVSLERFVENHRDRAKGVTRLYDQNGPLDIWLIDGERIRKNQHLTCVRDMLTDRPSRYAGCSYVNRLENMSDLRRLAVDMLLMRCAARPGGTQTKPGVWIDEGAVVDKSVRLVGPSYVGRNARIRPSVLLTRFSHVESNCEIDFGSAIEDSSILSNTYVGPSLDVMHAVVSENHITHLQKNVALEILDPLLVGNTASNAPVHSVKHRAMTARWMERLIQTS
jgi:hypothetical protein